MIYNIIEPEKFKYIIDEKRCKIDDIKDQTRAKIDYVSNYVIEWLRVASNSQNSNKIYFIDAMSNCGIYKKFDLCTCLRVLDIFYKESLNHPNKYYYLYLNDYDIEKVNVLREIISKYKDKFSNNLFISISNEDASDFLDKINYAFNFNGSFEKKYVLLYVDPYNFPSKEVIESMLNFIKKNYCELMFNFFSSDIERNLFNDKQKDKSDKLVEAIKLFANIDTLKKSSNKMEYIVDCFVEKIKNTKYIEYYFKYDFNISTNKEIYQIMFFSPSIAGLKQLKKSLWEVFEGYPEYWSKRKRDYDSVNLFGYTPEEQRIVDQGEIVINYLLKLGETRMNYARIEEICLSRTLLVDSHIINYVIKPMIEQNKLAKCNLVRKSNYKKDEYILTYGKN